MAGIKIAFIEDVTSFLRGTEQAERALDDVADSLDDLAADAQRQGRAAGDDLTRGVQDGAQDAQRAVGDVGDALGDLSRTADREAGTAGRNLAQGIDGGTETATDSVQELERSFADLAAGVRQEAKTTGDELGDSVSRGAQEASEGTDALRENAGSNAKEVAASFDGSAQSIADGFQGLAAEAFEGFGPAGLAAGVAVAAGMGLITSSMEKAKEEAQETAENIAEITGQLIDLGSLRLADANVVDSLKEAATSAEEGKVKITQWAEAAAKAGIDFGSYARGLAGDSDSLRASYAEVTSALAANKAKADAVYDKYGYYSKQAVALRHEQIDTTHGLLQARDALVAQDGTLDQAAKTTQLYTEATKGLTQTNEEAVATQEAYNDALAANADPVDVFTQALADEQAALDESARKTAEASKSKTDSMETYAKKAKVSTDDLIKEWNRQAKQAEDFEKNLAEIAANGGQALADELRKKGPEVAGAVAETIAESGPEKQKKAIEAHARATGQEISTQTAKGITDNAGKIDTAVTDAVGGVTAPKLKVDVDLTDAKRTLKGWAPRVTVTPRLGQEVR